MDPISVELLKTTVACESYLTIDLDSIAYNARKIQEFLPVMAMVKANGYGTDAAILAKFLRKLGIKIFGVAHPDEAIRLRKSGIEEEIFVIHAGTDEVDKIVDAHLQVAVSSKEMIRALKGGCIKVHLHVDTGMSRLGCRPEEALSLAKEIRLLPHLEFVGLMTHFACADSEQEDPFTALQIERFRSVIKELKQASLLPPLVHAANSSATIRKLFPEGNLARVGLALFGIRPHQQQLLAVLTLTSKIVAINCCKKGDTISYGRRHLIEKEEALIAVIPLGYFDGMQRHYSGKASLLVRGQKAPMVGTICMDFMMIDVTEIAGVSVGDEVLIFGEDRMGNRQSVEEFAQLVGTCPHELITCLGPRIQRLYRQKA